MKLCVRCNDHLDEDELDLYEFCVDKELDDMYFDELEDQQISGGDL